MFGKNKGDKSYVKKRAVQYGLALFFNIIKNKHNKKTNEFKYIYLNSFVFSIL